MPLRLRIFFVRDGLCFFILLLTKINKKHIVKTSFDASKISRRFRLSTTRRGTVFLYRVYLDFNI